MEYKQKSIKDEPMESEGDNLNQISSTEINTHKSTFEMVEENKDVQKIKLPSIDKLIDQKSNVKSKQNDTLFSNFEKK